jgi:hypothetical protein
MMQRSRLHFIVEKLLSRCATSALSGLTLQNEYSTDGSGTKGVETTATLRHTNGRPKLKLSWKVSSALDGLKRQNEHSADDSST